VTLLSFRDVASYYGSARILDGVSLEVRPGERIGVLGRNGVGKTTVANTILGIAAMKAGRIEIGGRELKNPRHFDAAHAGISIVPQGRRIIPVLTVRENLQLGAATRRPGPWTVEAIYDLFPILRERADRPGTALSGGQQQMLAIGRALMANPDLLVLDEPSEGLAPVIVDQLVDVLNRLGRAGTAIMLIEQNIGFVRDVVERYYVLSKGRVVDQGRLDGVSLEALKAHVSV
jgi:branched-chain amino acid transport system ATP-binding protein